MTAITLTYFDFDGGRGEDCRLALHLAGVPFMDDRVPPKEWMGRKAETPFGALPVLSVEGAPKPLAQSNAILTWIGRQHGLHPTDPWEAARHEALMNAVEEIRGELTPSLRTKDPEEKKRLRETAATEDIPRWGAQVEAQLGDGPFVAGATLNVVDLKLAVVARWWTAGVLDHVPTTVLDGCPKLLALCEAVYADPRVKAWYASRATA